MYGIIIIMCVCFVRQSGVIGIFSLLQQTPRLGSDEVSKLSWAPLLLGIKQQILISPSGFPVNFHFQATPLLNMAQSKMVRLFFVMSPHLNFMLLYTRGGLMILRSYQHVYVNKELHMKQFKAALSTLSVLIFATKADLDTRLINTQCSRSMVLHWQKIETWIWPWSGSLSCPNVLLMQPI